MKIPFLSIVDDDGDTNFVNLLLAIILIGVVAMVGYVVIRHFDYASDAATQQLQVNDPDRVQDLRTQVLNRYRALESQRDDIVSLQAARADLVEGRGDRSRWPLDVADQYEQMGTQLLQLETAFNSACGQFRAFISDPARNVALPSDLPRECPTLPAS